MSRSLRYLDKPIIDDSEREDDEPEPQRFEDVMTEYFEETDRRMR